MKMNNLTISYTVAVSRSLAIFVCLVNALNIVYNLYMYMTSTMTLLPPHTANNLLSLPIGVFGP